MTSIRIRTVVFVAIDTGIDFFVGILYLLITVLALVPLAEVRT